MKVTSPSIASGVLLGGKYRIERALGEGGMGVVLAAMNEALRQRVAIKLLRSGALANAKALGRFEREARAAAKLRSEHVARVLDVGKFDDGRPYMVMEFLEGRDLGDIIDKRSEPLPIAQSIEWVLQACEAIAEAHGIGIIHRDLKPSNLFLTTTVDGRGLVKVLDFGISKMEEEESENMSLTKTTEVIGSPSYMSPEQLRASKDVDLRTDVWALGVILYELLTGKLPFYAETVTDLVAVVMTESPLPPSQHRPEIPAPLEAAVLRCLCRKREERFASVVELVNEIAPYGNVAGATLVDRVRGAALGSGRSLPPAGGSSGTLPPAASSSAELLPTVADTQSNEQIRAVLRHTPSGYPAGVGARAPSSPSSRPSSRPSSSARLQVHGGTSVAWGETQVDDGTKPPVPRSKLPLLFAAAALALTLGGATTGAFYYAKHATAKDTRGGTGPNPPATATAPPSALPEGRKDLPPIASDAPSATPSTAEPSSSATTMPTTRGPLANGGKGKPSGPGPAKGTKPGPGATPAAPNTETATAPATPPPSTPTKAPDDLSNIGRR